jgi:hypothetical protein
MGCIHSQAEKLLDSNIPICLKCWEARATKGKPPVTADQVRTTLIEGVLEAMALKNKAFEAFEMLKEQFPNGLPSPNGSQLIKDVSEELSMARRRTMTAHNRLNDFLARGIVPEDLKRTA